MDFKYWVDNRNVRDNSYLGPLILPYDETNYRHKNVVGKINMGSAIKTIKNILTNDLEVLEKRIINQSRFLKEREDADDDLTFKLFYKDFYFLIERLVKEGHKFQPIGENILTLKRLRELYQLQQKEIWEEGNPFKVFIDLKNHVTITERIFEPIYREHKDEIGWFWDNDMLNNGKYKSLEKLQEVYNNCKERLKEINNG